MGRCNCRYAIHHARLVPALQETEVKRREDLRSRWGVDQFPRAAAIS